MLFLARYIDGNYQRLYLYLLFLEVCFFFLIKPGRRNNTLRNRIDSAEYDLDQLILAAILFTVLVLLFPTVTVYYLLFSICRLVIIFAQGFLEILLAILNHFPLFCILLRIKDPYRVSCNFSTSLIVIAGLSFKLFNPNVDNVSFIFTDLLVLAEKNFIESDNDKLGKPNTINEISLNSSYLIMNVRKKFIHVKSVPIKFSSIFYQYNYIWNE